MSGPEKGIAPKRRPDENSEDYFKRAGAFMEDVTRNQNHLVRADPEPIRRWTIEFDATDSVYNQVVAFVREHPHSTLIHRVRTLGEEEG